MGHRPRHRRRRPRSDPARGVPGSLSRTCRRRERPDARARQANRLIPAGTPGTLVASQSMYTSTTLPQKEVVVGAIADPAYLSGRAAATDIFPGAQLTATASRRATPRRSTPRSRARSARSRSRSTTSTGRSRRCRPATRSTSTSAVAGVVKLFRPNVKVLTDSDASRPEPAAATSCCGSRRATRRQFAYAADNTQFCFVLRPVVGAKPTKPSQANASTVLR